MHIHKRKNKGTYACGECTWMRRSVICEGVQAARTCYPPQICVRDTDAGRERGKTKRDEKERWHESAPSRGVTTSGSDWVGWGRHREIGGGGQARAR